MAIRDDLTGHDALHQGNDETVLVTITPTSTTEDLTGVTRLEAVFKPDTCTADTSTYALVLSSTVPTEINITSQTADLITAEIYIPGTYLTEPYNRVWRVDAISGSGGGRTAIFGDVEVTDL